jgi:hypothetical protein
MAKLNFLRLTLPPSYECLTAKGNRSKGYLPLRLSITDRGPFQPPCPHRCGPNMLRQHLQRPLGPILVNHSIEIQQQMGHRDPRHHYIKRNPVMAKDLASASD